MAYKNYQNPIWLVGDLANILLTSQSCHVILNILSPANYMEFKRVLASENGRLSGIRIGVLSCGNGPFNGTTDSRR